MSGSDPTLGTWGPNMLPPMPKKQLAALDAHTTCTPFRAGLLLVSALLCASSWFDFENKEQPEAFVALWWTKNRELYYTDSFRQVPAPQGNHRLLGGLTTLFY